MQSKPETGSERQAGRHRIADNPPADRLPLWRGWVPALAAWLLHLYASFALVDWYCREGGQAGQAWMLGLLHGVTLLCLLLAVLGCFLGWLNLRRLQRSADDEQSRTRFTRRRFLALGGLLLSGYLAVVILMQGLANFVLVPCQ